MNPLVQSLISAGVRWAVTVAAAHQITVSNDQATQIASGLAALAMLIWSAVHKKKVDTAIKSAKAGV